MPGALIGSLGASIHGHIHLLDVGIGERRKLGVENPRLRGKMWRCLNDNVLAVLQKQSLVVSAA